MARGTFVIRRTRMPGVEAVEAETDHIFPKHTHQEFGIGLIHRGAQSSLSGRGMVEAGAGTLITVNPGEVHDGSPIGDHGRAWRMLYFDPAVIAELSADIRETSCTREFHHPTLADGRVTTLFRALYETMTAEDGTSLSSESLLLSLTAILISDNPPLPLAHAQQAIRHAIAMIDDAPESEISLADLARASKLSRFQTLRAISRATGLTPHAYQLQRRLDLARRLIRTGQALADAAAASGFADQSHMTRAFAARYGVTPGAYAAAIA